MSERGRARGFSLAAHGVALAAAVASLVYLYGPSLRDSVRHALQRGIFHDDARQQIFEFHRYADPTLLRDDPITDYFLSLFPVGYHALYAFAAVVGDAAWLSQRLPFALLAVTITAVGFAAHRLGGSAAAWASVALALSCTPLLAGLGGGIPHSFALPMLAVGLALLVHGRMLALAVLVPITVGFYPVVAVILGLTLAIVLLVVPEPDRGSARDASFRRRGGVLVASGLATLVLVLPPALGSRHWGELVGPEQFEAYPEAGPGGRYGHALDRPFPGFVESIPGGLKKALDGKGTAWSAPARVWAGETATRKRALVHGLLLAIGAGWLGLACREPAARRLAAFPLALLIGHTASLLLDPLFYLAPRYLGHGLPALFLVLTPAAIGGLFAWVPRPGVRRVIASAAAFAGGVGLLLLFGGQVASKAVARQSARSHARVLKATAAMPVDVLVAGWPGASIEWVPLLARRRAFLTYETHQAFHTGYMDLMRSRMDALTDAYFATALAPLERLRDEFGVTHLIVDLRHFEGRPPGYFQPFGTRIRAAANDARGRALVPELAEQYASFRAGHVVVLPLAALSAAEPAAP